MQGSARRDTSAWASALALPARTFIVCPCCENRGTLSRHTGEGMVTPRPNRPARGSASALRVGLPQLRRSNPHCWGSWAVFKRVERARSRDVQGGVAGPRSGRKRSAPRSSPLAAAATTPYGSEAIGPHRRYRSANLNHEAILGRLRSDSSKISGSMHSLRFAYSHGRSWDFSHTSSVDASLLRVLPRTQLILCDRRPILCRVGEHHIHPAILGTSRHRRVRRDVLALRGARVQFFGGDTPLD
jgi:hypothetical protein